MNATPRAAALVRSLAARLNLSVTVFGDRVSSADAPGTSGTLVLCGQGMIDPAPVTPPAAPLFRLLASTIRAVSVSGAPAAPHCLPIRALALESSHKCLFIFILFLTSYLCDKCRGDI